MHHVLPFETCLVDSSDDIIYETFIIILHNLIFIAISPLTTLKGDSNTDTFL